MAYGHDATIVVRNQQGFDQMNEDIREAANVGKKDIVVKIKKGRYLFHEDHLTLKGLPDGISIKLKGEDVRVYAEGGKVGHTESIYNSNVYYQGRKKVVVDNWTDVRQSEQLIEVVDSLAKVCRLKTNDGDIATIGDMIQVSQWYMTYTYPVIDNKDGYTYFTANNLKRCDGGKSWNLNFDYVYAKEYPRYRIWSTSNNRKKTCEGNAIRFINAQNVRFKYLTLEGICFYGNAYQSSGALLSLFGVKADKVCINNCEFRNCHSTCILLGNSTNTIINNCKFYDNLTTGIKTNGWCENVQVTDCLFENNSCGWNNTFCVNIKGRNFLVARNTFRDFGYGAVGIGEHYSDKKVWVSGVIEGNEIYYTSQYYTEYWKHTLMDGAQYIFGHRMMMLPSKTTIFTTILE